MKKLLLLGAAAITAMGAMADLPAATPFTGGADITPDAYKFYEYDGEWRGFVSSNAGQPANLDVAWYANHIMNGEIPFNDGVIVTGGQQAYVDGKPFENLQNATQVVDFGGNLGKCLVINGYKSNLESKLKELGVDCGTLKKFEGTKVDDSGATVGNAVNAILYFMLDPETLGAQLAAGKNKIRVRITMNAYHGFNAATFAQPTTVKIYCNTDQNNVSSVECPVGGEPNNPISYDEFVRFNYEVPEFLDELRAGGFPEDAIEAILNEPYENDNSAYEWNPERFMVLEFDALNVRAMDTDANTQKEVYYGTRLKWVVNPSILNNDAALIIRSVEYFVNDTDDVKDPYLDNSGFKTYQYFTMGKDESGVSDAIATPVQDGRIYNLQGIEVTNATVPGIYIQNGKKFIVK